MPRELERVPFLSEVRLEGFTRKAGARISDLSPGGCYIDSIAAVNADDPIELTIIRSDGEEMLFTGEVAYAMEGVGFGVRFTNVSDTQQKFLSEIIEANA